MTDELRIDARMALATYESSFAAFGTEACFTMKDVHVVREYIDRLEKAYVQQQQVWSDAIARSDRYEAALQEIIKLNDDWEPEFLDDNSGTGYEDCANIARSALEKKDE